MNASHITALKSKHATLDQAIAEEMRKPAPDDAAIQSLKKQKLRLKEEMGGV
ncbi:MAG: YdcH family protein [Erythrobacter sp.]|nr:YdcH family protein [Erythrobacter sp.]NCQ64771.1 YdcH family protein [Alphaproteobacteria bacterium]